MLRPFTQFVFATVLLLLLSSSTLADDDGAFDATGYIALTQALSTNEMAGRAPGTVGSVKARGHLLEILTQMGLDPVWDELVHPFTLADSGVVGAKREETGANLVFQIEGENSDNIIIVTAHYDHLGIVDGAIFNGADDNASGVAGVMAIADHFLEHPPENDIVFAIVDAEETGSGGAIAFVEMFERLDQVRLNLNLDMISRSDVNELYVSGGYHYPQFVPFLDELATRVPVTLLQGHDDPSLPEGQDWTQGSDHRVFHNRGIPFIYFGVEDHDDYHEPTDDFERIPLDFFGRSLETVVIAAEAIDENLASLLPGTTETEE